MKKQEISKEYAVSLLNNKLLKPRLFDKKTALQVGAKEVYVLEDKRAILVYETSFFITDFLALFNHLIKIDKILLDSPNAQTIINGVERELTLFSKFFPNDYYDYSMNSVAHLDKDYPLLMEQGISEAEVFLPIVCYVGEVFKKATNGEWTIKKDKKKEVVSVKGENGTYYDPYTRIQKILINAHHSHDFQAAVESQLYTIIFQKANPIIAPWDKIEWDK